METCFMDTSLRVRAEQLAQEFAGQATTVDDLNVLLRMMTKSALERMLNTELDVHLGRRPLAISPGVNEPLSESPPASAAPAELPKPRKRAPNRRNGHSPKTV